MSRDPGLVAVVLAAGAGVRFSGPSHKLVAAFRGRRVIDLAVAAPLDAGFERVVVVTGETPLDLPHDERVVEVENPAAASGQATSLQVGVAAAAALDANGVVVGLGDSPLVGSDAWRTVGEAAGALVVATYDGVAAPPVKIMANLWDLLPTSGDEGARQLFRLRPELVTRVPCGGLAVDIDTGEDLARWS